MKSPSAGDTPVQNSTRAKHHLLPAANTVFIERGGELVHQATSLQTSQTMMESLTLQWHQRQSGHHWCLGSQCPPPSLCCTLTITLPQLHMIKNDTGYYDVVIIIIIFHDYNFYPFPSSFSVFKAKEVKDAIDSKGAPAENKDNCKVNIQLHHSHSNNVFSI